MSSANRSLSCQWHHCLSVNKTSLPGNPTEMFLMVMPELLSVFVLLPSNTKCQADSGTGCDDVTFTVENKISS